LNMYDSGIGRGYDSSKERKKPTEGEGVRNPKLAGKKKRKGKKKKKKKEKKKKKKKEEKKQKKKKKKKKTKKKKKEKKNMTLKGFVNIATDVPSLGKNQVCSSRGGQFFQGNLVPLP